ncbi:hypothetical protein V8E55_009202 [Tylopilus felleus]
MPSSEPYHGSSQKLALAFDIGTTYSGILYCTLDPGEVLGVSRYPAQEHVGAQKRYSSTSLIKQKKDKLECDTSMWRSLENNIDFILATHPNGWEELQQQQIRRAAEIAGLVPSGDDAGRIHLLTEGEASLQFCVTHLLSSDSLNNIPILSSNRFEEEVEENLENQGIVIIDTGGGIIDLSAYSVRLSPPRELKEIAPTECHLQGSVFVTQRAHMFLHRTVTFYHSQTLKLVMWVT